jgi:hypothetical protein
MQTTDGDTAMTTLTPLITVPSSLDIVPAPTDSYDAVRFNAMRHGILSRYTVLAHESVEDYQALLTALAKDHAPAGATQMHLVEELAGIIWRKRRVLLAEGANINQGLKGSARDAERVIPAAAPFERGLSGKGTDIRELMDLTPAEIAERKRDALEDLEATRRAAAILRRGSQGAYEKALRALRADSRAWFDDHVADEEFPGTAEGLADFINKHLEPFCMQAEKGARHHEAIKSQALGEGLQAHRLEKLNRYETHLDRKFERTLGMLLKLKELKRGL